MKTAVINIKTSDVLKVQAHSVAEELGLSLSAILNAYLKQLVRTKNVYFDTTSEKPSDYLRNALRASEEERRLGENSPAFTDQESASSWLRDKRNK